MCFFGFGGLQILSYCNINIISDPLTRIILGVTSSFLSWLIVIIAVVYLLTSNNQFALFFLEQGNYSYPNKRFRILICIWAIFSGQYHFMKCVEYGFEYAWRSTPSMWHWLEHQEYLSIHFDLIGIQLFLITVLFSFLYLADVSFETAND